MSRFSIPDKFFRKISTPAKIDLFEKIFFVSLLAKVRGEKAKTTYALKYLYINNKCAV